MKGANMKAHWLRRLLVLFIEHTKPTTEQAIITMQKPSAAPF